MEREPACIEPLSLTPAVDRGRMRMPLSENGSSGYLTVICAATALCMAAVAFAESRSEHPADAVPARGAPLWDTGLFWLANSARSVTVRADDDAQADRGTVKSAGPFVYTRGLEDRGRAVDCLAEAAWYEAGGHDIAGQRAVMQVVLNRLRDRAFPKSVCGVVFDGSERDTGCQFTFTCDGSRQRRTPSPQAWQQSRALASEALDGAVDKSVGMATHYHADYVTPWWSAALRQVGRVGRHIFYIAPSAPDPSPIASLLTTAENGLPAVDVQSGPAGAGANEAMALANVPQLEFQPVGIDPPGMSLAAAVRVRRSAMVVKIDQTASTGRWAINAMTRCENRSSCLVIGYDDAASVDRNRNADETAMDRPLFVFVRDANSGTDLALWDCQRVGRPSPTQCLPEESPALQRLLRDR